MKKVLKVLGIFLLGIIGVPLMVVTCPIWITFAVGFMLIDLYKEVKEYFFG